MDGFQGVEMDNAKRAATQLEECEDSLTEAGRRLELSKGKLVWEGDSAKAFKDDWDFQFVGDLSRAITMLADYAGGIRAAIATQKTVSEAE
jgi:uncharacterized protein YukE